MSSLRRLAQTNNASTPTGSSRPSGHRTGSGASGSASGSSSPVTPSARPRYSYLHSPSSTPSISSSTPFDWDAAKSMRPPPYGTPESKRKSAQRLAGGGAAGGTPRRAVIRKKGILERISAIPSEIAFQAGMFPDNIPMPSPKTSAWLLGGGMHFLHLLVRVSQIRKVPDSDLGWEEMYRESEGSSWFDWTVPTTILLVLVSLSNALYLFTRLRAYRLLKRSTDAVSSPSARFVSTDLDDSPFQSHSMLYYVGWGAWHIFCTSWRFLLNLKPASASASRANKGSKIQQLDMWAPGELEMTLFSVYSPVHSLLWMATGSANWMMMLIIMGCAGVQMRVLTRSYNGLIKDKEIIAAEVMHEYNEEFVYPKLNPIRKDVAVMTSQAETVDIWGN